MSDNRDRTTFYPDGRVEEIFRGELVVEGVPAYGIDITSWIGSIGAEHWYAKVWRDLMNRKTTQSVERKLSKREAAYLNRKDRSFGPFGFYEPGDMTDRFNDEQSARNAAIRLIRETYGAVPILDGDVYEEYLEVDGEQTPPTCSKCWRRLNPDGRCAGEVRLESSGWVHK